MPIDPIEFVRKHGVVLESAKGPVPNLADAVAGSPIHGNWWNHPAGKQIFRATRLVRDSEQVLVCRLVSDKVTYVDQQLWPAVVRLSKYFKRESLDAIREEHTSAGEHQIKTVLFPKWVPLQTRHRAKTLSEEEATRQIGPWAASLITD